MTGDVSDLITIGHEGTTGRRDTPVVHDEDRYVQTAPAVEDWVTISPAVRETKEAAVSGVFAVGGVMDSAYERAVIGAGTASMAAPDRDEWLEADEAVPADSSGRVSMEAGN